MGKNQSASGLTNIIQYDNNGNVSFVSGSTTLMQISSSGAITTTGVISGSNALSASYSLNSGLLNGTGSVGFATTASLLTVSSSQQQISASQQQLSSSFLTLTASFNAVSASQQQISASYIALSASYNTFSGSASTRITVDSASLLQVSASYIALSGSYNTYSSSVSTRTTQIEQVYATTGSNSFRATQSITGSLTVTGQIIAQTINVQQVTSSIIYSSGSNVFGCDLNSRQTFTGSVLITGSLTIAGASSATSYSGATIYGSTAVCSAVGKFTTCIDAGSGTFSDNVLISKANLLSSLTIKSSCSTTGLQLYLYGLNATLSNQDSGSLVFQTNGNDRLTIASTGAATFSNVVKIDQATSSAAAHFTVNAPSNTSDLGLRIEVASSMKWFIGMPNNIVNDNFSIFYGPSSADRLTIDTSGNVGIGTSTFNYAGAGTGYLAINGSSSNFLEFQYGTTGTSGWITGNSSTLNMFTSGPKDLLFGTAGGEKMRITSGGNVGIGTTTPNTLLEIGSTTISGSEYSAYTTSVSGGTSSKYSFWRNYSGGSSAAFRAAYMANYNEDDAYNCYNKQHLVFATKSGTAEPVERMRITSAGITCFGFTVCAPCFATISDYRMKSNIRPIAGLSIIMNTKPYKFEYNYDCSTSFGMIAHELQDTVPEAVFGYKDGEVMQGVDYMKLLPIAIKAIQEQQCKIALLESCLGIA